ncbi:hypothetical protein ACOSP7_002463 [Xanthoceras sorbifolium]
MEEDIESTERNTEQLEPCTRSYPDVDKDQPQSQQVDGVDRISSLPETILYHILSFLPPVVIEKTAILSRKWKLLFNKLPIIDIDELDNLLKFSMIYNEEPIGITKCREVFLEALRLKIKNHDMIFLQKLRIRTASKRDDEIDSVITQLLAAALTTKARLDLQLMIYLFSKRDNDSYYVLPALLFSCGSCLVSLFLQGCILENYDSIDLPSLKRLELDHVMFSDQMLSKFISSLPSIDTLELIKCDGMKNLMLSNSNLKFLEVIWCRKLIKFEMDVPSLQTFKFQGIDEFVDFNFTLISDPEVQASNVTSCPSLHTIHLIDVKFERKAFNSMISSIPGIENMTLESCRFTSVPKIESAKLKKLEVIDCYLKNKVLIIAPQLESFSMECNNDDILRPSLSDLQFKSLKALSLEGSVELTDNLLEFMISFLSQLETLHLSTCTGFKHMRIISKSIKFLVVDECLDVEDGEIEAPELLFFKYVGYLPDFSHVSASEQLSVELHLLDEIIPETHLFTSYLERLSHFVSKFDNVRHVIVSKLYQNDFYPRNYIEIMGENITVSEMIYLEKHLKLKISMETDAVLIDIIGAIFDTPFCPRSLLVDMGSSAAKLQFHQEDLNSGCNADDNHHDCLKDDPVEVSWEDFQASYEEMLLLNFLLDRMEKCRSVVIAIKSDCSNQLRSEIMSCIRACPKASQYSEIAFSGFCILQRLKQ